MDGSSLVMNPVANRTGSGHITVTATDVDGTRSRDTFLVTVGGSAKGPTIGGLIGSPNPVLRNSQLLSLTAWGVSSAGSDVTRVEFYDDSNGDGVLEPGVRHAARPGHLGLRRLDPLRGDGGPGVREPTRSSPGRSMPTTTAAHRSRSPFHVVNKPPMLTSVSPLVATSRQDSWTITYEDLKSQSNAADANGDTIQFRIEQVTSGTLARTARRSWPAPRCWRRAIRSTWTPPNGPGFVYNAFTVRAYDGLAASATAVPVKVQIDRAPDGLFARGLTPTPIAMPGGTVTLSATASDPDDSVGMVEFFYDLDGNGSLDVASDEYLGSGTVPYNKWTLAA